MGGFWPRCASALSNDSLSSGGAGLAAARPAGKGLMAGRATAWQTEHSPQLAFAGASNMSPSAA